MYECPINTIMSDIETQFEQEVLKVVQQYDIVVDKDELVKALNYDRQQYEKGYADAKAEQRWIPCSDRPPEESGEYLCTLVGVHNTGLPSECGYELPNNRGIISGWSTCDADGFKFLRDDEVLAWMPLPERWRGEELCVQVSKEK